MARKVIVKYGLYFSIFGAWQQYSPLTSNICKRASVSSRVFQKKKKITVYGLEQKLQIIYNIQNYMMTIKFLGDLSLWTSVHLNSLSRPILLLNLDKTKRENLSERLLAHLQKCHQINQSWLFLLLKDWCFLLKGNVKTDAPTDFSLHLQVWV